MKGTSLGILFTTHFIQRVNSSCKLTVKTEGYTATLYKVCGADWIWQYESFSAAKPRPHMQNCIL